MRDINKSTKKIRKITVLVLLWLLVMSLLLQKISQIGNIDQMFRCALVSPYKISILKKLCFSVIPMSGIKYFCISYMNKYIYVD